MTFVKYFLIKYIKELSRLLFLSIKNTNFTINNVILHKFMCYIMYFEISQIEQDDYRGAPAPNKADLNII